MDNEEADYFWQQKLANGHTRIGLAPKGQDEVGTVGFVDLPQVSELNVGDFLLSVESDKAVTELHTPCAGQVVQFNQALVEQPELLNDTDQQHNWIVELA